MSRFRIDLVAIQAAEIAVAAAETKELEARTELGQHELRMQTLRWAQQQAGYEYHNHISGSGLYMTAYGSSRRHTNRCNAAMDRKEQIDRKYVENMEDCQLRINEAAQIHDETVEKVRQAKEVLRNARRGF
jgi:hypothetical protein